MAVMQGKRRVKKKEKNQIDHQNDGKVRKEVTEDIDDKKVRRMD